MRHRKKNHPLYLNTIDLFLRFVRIFFVVYKKNLFRLFAFFAHYSSCARNMARDTMQTNARTQFQRRIWQFYFDFVMRHTHTRKKRYLSNRFIFFTRKNFVFSFVLKTVAGPQGCWRDFTPLQRQRIIITKWYCDWVVWFAFWWIRFHLHFHKLDVVIIVII